MEGPKAPQPTGTASATGSTPATAANATVPATLPVAQQQKAVATSSAPQTAQASPVPITPAGRPQNPVAGAAPTGGAANVQGATATPQTPAVQQNDAQQSEAPGQAVTAAASQAKQEIRPPTFLIGKPSRTKYIKGLIYGPYGVGKTHLAATAADVSSMSDVLVCDAESGSMTLADRADQIDIIPIGAFSQFARVYEYLRYHCQARDANDENKLRQMESWFRQVPMDQIKKPKHYRTCIIDSLTEVQKYCMYQLLGIRIGEQPLDLEPPKPEWSEWGKLADMMRLLIRSFRDLPMNVLFVCAEAMEQDEQKRYHYGPNLSGKLALEAQGFLDVVGYLRAAPPTNDGQIVRRLFLQPGQFYAAKDRYHANNSVAFIDNPTMKSFMEAQ